jgi:hypothetical protein
MFKTESQKRPARTALGPPSRLRIDRASMSPAPLPPKLYVGLRRRAGATGLAPMNVMGAAPSPNPPVRAIRTLLPLLTVQLRRTKRTNDGSPLPISIRPSAPQLPTGSFPARQRSRMVHSIGSSIGGKVSPNPSLQRTPPGRLHRLWPSMRSAPLGCQPSDRRRR